MSYRKITVKGREYEYTIGRTHTKIKGVGVFPNEDIAEQIEIPEYCECCGEPLSILYSDHVVKTKPGITPGRIRRKIERIIR